MSANFNPFAALLDPAAILTRCEQSSALSSLPLSAKRCADRQRAAIGELALYDAEVEAVYQALLAKATKTKHLRSTETA